MYFTGGEKTTRRRPQCRVPSRKEKRPWIRCNHCLTRLAQVDVIDGKPCLPVGKAHTKGNVTLICPKCGVERVFYA